MRNPFKVGDKVLTKVTGAEVEAVVTNLWEHYVQVRTPDKELRWRSIYTVWYLGGTPLARPAKQPAIVKASTKGPAKALITASGKNGAVRRKSVRRARSRKHR